MSAVRDLDLFQRFVKLCAARTGQLLNFSSLAAECGISHVTAGEWLGVLEASYIVMRLPPYYRSFGKRLVKPPKLYFLDVGLAAWLLGIRDPVALNIHAQRGALFETMIVGDFLKARYNRRQAHDLYFWRDDTGHELDLLYEEDAALQGVEIKSGATLTSDWLRASTKWRNLAGASALPPVSSTAATTAIHVRISGSPPGATSSPGDRSYTAAPAQIGVRPNSCAAGT